MSGREELVAAYLRLHSESAARLIESMPVEQANAVLKDLGVSTIFVVGVAKGEERRAGHETLILPDGRELRPGAAADGTCPLMLRTCAANCQIW